MAAGLALAALAFSSCQSGGNGNGENGIESGAGATVRVAAMRGPTALGLLALMRESDESRTQGSYEFTLLGSPVEVPPLLVGGEIDAVAVPGNLAAILYNQTEGDVVALAIVTLGVLHLVDATGEINSVEDLRGRTVHVIGQAATPEFALNYVLGRNGLVPGEDVFVEFGSENAEVAALLETGQAQLALLPEPFVSTVLAGNPGLSIALDWTEEWNRVQPDYGLIMSVVVARRAFVEENPAAAALLLEEYERSIRYVLANTASAAQMAVDFGIIPNLAIAESALPRTHVVFISGEEMRRNLVGFYGVLHDESPAIIGGAMPGDGFYHIP